jgi:hypothetical protein
MEGLDFFKGKITHICSMKEQYLAIDTREDALFPEKRPTTFHFSHRQARQSPG